MTPLQLQRMLDKAGLSQRAAAKAIGINERHMRRLIAGEVEISKTIEIAVTCICTHSPQSPPEKSR